MVRNFAFAVLALMAGAALAQDTTPKVQLHGFGEWAYARTDGNEYLDGNEEGDWDTVGFGLNATTNIGDRLTITGQLALRSNEEDGMAAELDYAFAQWRFSDALQVRAGRSKHPFGIYTEIFDIGTLRPFFHLPMSFYGPTEIAAQSYNGIGLTGLWHTGESTSLDYDLYVGEVTFDASQSIQAEEEHIGDVVGGRLRYHTSIDGLSFGGSAYTGATEEEEEDELGEELEEDSPRNSALGLHGEYAMAPWTLRGEVGRHTEEGEGETTSFYLEAAYRIGENFELAGRFDRFETSLEEDDHEGEVIEHQDIAVGANYWFNPNLVVKLSLHKVSGLGAVAPVDDEELDNDTTALFFGAQFSF